MPLEIQKMSANDWNKGEKDSRVQNGLEKGDKDRESDEHFAQELSRKQRDDLERERLRASIDNWDADRQRANQGDSSDKDQASWGGQGQKSNKAGEFDTQNKKDSFDTQAQSKNVRG